MLLLFFSYTNSAKLRVQTDIGNDFIMDDYILEYRLNRI